MDKTKKTFDYDLAVLGGGSAGFSAARTAAAAGLETVLIEGGGEVGGLCILRGCMPSKALLYVAEVLQLARRAGALGLRVPAAGFDFEAVMARKDRMIEDFAAYRREQLENGGFQWLRASAAFEDSHTLRLSPVAGGREGQTLRARHFIIATGSVVSPSPLPRLADAGYITSDDALVLKRLPKSLIVLGGGATGCELGQLFARFDVKVTMLQRGPHVLHGFDQDAAEVVETVFRREGIELYTGTELLDASRLAGGKSVTFRHQGAEIQVEAEEILFCLGRTANTAGLGLERIGVELDGRRIITNAGMRTSQPHIHAVGDCSGTHEVVHRAIREAEIAAGNISRPENPAILDDRLSTSVIFTDPQVARVGLGEKEAAADGVPFIAASYPFKDHGKSLIMEETDGFVKLLANPQSGEIIGGACAGPAGGDLIHEIIAAMAKRMTVHELASMPHYHPTLAEIWTVPAEELAGKIPH